MYDAFGEVPPLALSTSELIKLLQNLNKKVCLTEITEFLNLDKITQIDLLFLIYARNNLIDKNLILHQKDFKFFDLTKSPEQIPKSFLRENKFFFKSQTQLLFQSFMSKQLEQIKK